MPEVVGQSEVASLLAQWRARTPWWRRPFAQRGLQAKLIIAFLLLLFVALGGTCYLFVLKTRQTLRQVMGEQATQLSVTLALASKSPMADGNTHDLDRIGRDLLKSRNIVFVGFYDATGRALAVACRDPDFTQQDSARLSLARRQPQQLMQVRQERSTVLGDYLSVVAPVIGAGPSSASRLMGYVTVGVAQSREDAQIQNTSYLALAMGLTIFLLSLPLVMALVHRILHPIRQLRRAANRIAAGDYDTTVAADRPDEIGDLARAFNEMTRRVKEQQEALKEANHDLEGRIRQRTRELQDSNQRLSSEIAEKEDFLRAVSHDLNAPLRNIGGMAAMLLLKHKGKLDDDIIHRIERIQKNVDVESDLLGELLELSRIKTRREKIENVNLGDLVRDVGGIFENDLRTRAIELSVDDTLPEMVCEKSRLRQVFQNLIDNAIKYMGDGAVRQIHVGYRLLDEDVEFHVRDTGMGIDGEDLPKVFGVFRRGRNGAARNIPGKGVGLACVKSIVENYGGRIWVESDVGKGTTFLFTLPRRHLAGSGGAAIRQSQTAEAAQS